MLLFKEESTIEVLRATIARMHVAANIVFLVKWFLKFFFGIPKHHIMY
jgi:hypothetical protein